MKSLPDPRRYVAISSNPLAILAADAAQQGSALQQHQAGKSLLRLVCERLAAGDDAGIASAFTESGSRAAYDTLRRALEITLQPAPDAAVCLRLFAVPVLFVTGGQAPVRLPGVLPDVAVVERLFVDLGAVGPLRNFALGSALIAAETLASIGPARQFRLGRGEVEGGFESLDLPPADIVVTSTEERVHLRFLAGAALTPADAPGFTETAGNIGAWGLAFTRELTTQLAQDGLSLLPIPRPPMAFAAALEAGLFTSRELGLQLFLSAALRGFRSSVGEPNASVAAYTDGSVRVSLASPFDTSPPMEYCWPLEPGDDIAAVGDSIFSLLAECRVANVQVAETVWLAKTASH